MEINNSDLVLIMGDFNAQLSNDNSNIEQIIGTHALGHLNESEEYLLELCHNHNFVIGMSIFPYKRIHKGP